MGFTLTTIVRGTQAVLQLAGELDLSTRDQLTERIATLISSGQPVVRADLTALTFMDSSGISSLLLSKRACEEAGGSFQVVGAQGEVEMALRITGVDRALSGPDLAPTPATEPAAV